MKFIETLRKRRSYYNINKEVPVKKEEIMKLIEEVTGIVPDAFNVESSKLVVAMEDSHDKLWDAIYDVFEGKVPREKIDSFKAGYGTVLYFIDQDIVKALQEKFPAYEDNFPVWTNHASGMLQHSIWVALRELNIGASLQHYNPVIDDMVKKMFGVPENYKLIAQMPFGGIGEEPEAKQKVDIKERIKFF